FAGEIDRIIRAKNEFYPVEIKTGKPPVEGVYYSHKIQACFSTILVENRFKIPVRLSFVEYTQLNEMRPVFIDEDLKKDVLRMTNEISKINEGYIPSKINRCKTCEYKGVC
ncbi:MAG TPA: Dna2/Cas4 domain-containing protein, partial [Methanomicrobia archaeon]|nr:Dna2/Cas4 domain-containing protein [Methanomicrobia archaeon]